MNLGQLFGMQELRIAELEEHIASGGGVVPLATASALPVGVSREAFEAEHQLRRQAEDALSEAQATIAHLRRLVMDLQAREPQTVERIVEKPVEVEKRVEVVKPCAVCESIKRMVLGVEPVPPRHASVSASAASIAVEKMDSEPQAAKRADVSAIVASLDRPRFEAPVGDRTRVYRGYHARILQALTGAERPLTSAEIGGISGIESVKVSTNIWHLVRAGLVSRSGSPGRNGSTGRYRYELARKEAQCSSLA